MSTTATTAPTAPDLFRAGHLTPEHESTVKATLPLVGAHINEITPNFYARMFEEHPELLRDTFNRGNQRAGDQQKALAASVATFASMLVDPSAPDPVAMLSRIAHKHVSLGITADQYQIVHDHLFAAIVEVLGDAVTPPVAEAWDEVYWLMAQVLIDAETGMYQSAGVAPGDVFRDAVLTERRALSATVTELTFVAATDFADARPGQYVSIGVVMADGARQLRQYSLVAWDAEGFRIAVQRDGEVSTALVDGIAVGDRVDATLPAGDLVLHRDVLTGAAPVVLVSSGIGSTPMTGMLSVLAARPAAGAPATVTVLHADEDATSHAQREVTEGYVEALRAAGATVHVQTAYRADGARIDLPTLADEGVLPSGAHWYLCGGNGFLQDIRAQLENMAESLAPAGVNVELFSPNDWLLGE
ncbi:globin domain-containing protein [Corynebacterium sp. AOP40-9SA-29]|uniref:globin domain-containing protein n=1 Tax=Corynebacterium sp. AOP40-9SA-29 TaxID=3457677 RepID=UPI004033520B